MTFKNGPHFGPFCKGGPYPRCKVWPQLIMGFHFGLCTRVEYEENRNHASKKALFDLLVAVDSPYGRGRWLRIGQKRADSCSAGSTIALP
jgi:hypothetical protein